MNAGATGNHWSRCHRGCRLRCWRGCSRWSRRHCRHPFQSLNGSLLLLLLLNLLFMFGKQKPGCSIMINMAIRANSVALKYIFVMLFHRQSPPLENRFIPVRSSNKCKACMVQCQLISSGHPGDDISGCEIQLAADFFQHFLIVGGIGFA